MQSLGMRRYEGGLGRPQILFFSFLSGIRFDCYALLLRIDCRLIIINSFPPCVTLPLLPARILFAASIAEKDKRFGVGCERLLMFLEPFAPMDY